METKLKKIYYIFLLLIQNSWWNGIPYIFCHHYSRSKKKRFRIRRERAVIATKNARRSVSSKFFSLTRTVFLRAHSMMIKKFKDKRMIILYAMPISLSDLCWARKTGISIIGTLTIMTVAEITLFFL